MTLRASLHAAIVQVLDTGDFLPTDFRIETENHHRGSTLQLHFQYANAFLIAEIPDRQSSDTEGEGLLKRTNFYYHIDIKLRPGRLNIEESTTATDVDSLLAAIKAWLERLRADLKNSPLARATQDHEQLIRELHEKIGLTDESDGPLESNQARSIVEWIKELEAKMADNLRKSEKDKKALEKKLAALHSQVEALCNIVKSHITKKGVIRALMGRVLGWTSKPENQQLLKDASATIGGLLVSGDKK